jgi:naphthalene 1,2-dioxygenase system ferredoxin subunit
MTGKWVEVAVLSDIPDDDVIGVVVEGRDVALYKVDGEVYATSNICTHGDVHLSDGFLEGREIECPLHQGRFDVCTGKALCAPVTEDVKTYSVKIEDQRVLIELS